MTEKLAKHAEILNVIDTLASRYLQGKVKALRLAIIALLSDGHLLLEDIPGLGKTTLALALSRALGLSFGRIQCTSDLLPSDITGLSIFDREKNSFRFIEGPIFNHILLADEINRAMPKTQSAMLEAMEERKVTVEGVSYPLPDPFMVIATQNPTEQIGTYPLPESQLDRFLITTGIGYPPAELEKQIIRNGGIREKMLEIEPLLSREDIHLAKQAVQTIHLDDKLVDYLLAIAEATRNHRFISAGISTRGAISMTTAARACAYLDGRDYVIPEDVKEIAGPVGAHRLILRNEHQSLNKREVMVSILNNVPVPMV
ncbi:MoxR family ATPase [Desulfuromonas acetoxidans]|uniref:ATPase associated with various cellular activities, AAA_3 n=1 Tax=Desulfuromonas acetoxidans (strain DSM 684 / 11070) TaxID=281689 RepID=Q1JVJ0_DESA6|nr:MoxR family ATPase [Desulfuromonas acetoxidans]EAT14258.1 ATPase associated with various cellular activities, AAA_3 [Desulfuromonas acetoxidans DSM 684]